MSIEWSPDKNAALKERYGFGFERVVSALDEDRLLDERKHPNPERYAHQRQLVVEIDGYAWVVCFVTDGSTMFFKTMYPSRRANREYLRGRDG
ncbi:MAG: toxin [Rhizobiales bacterium]|nr:toxin [Hyphomicrobiales bacterium]